MPSDDWVWIEDAAREYGKSRATLDAWVSAGRVRYDKRDKDPKTYVLRADVEREVAASPGSRLRPRPASQDQAV